VWRVVYESERQKPGIVTDTDVVKLVLCGTLKGEMFVDQLLSFFLIYLWFISRRFLVKNYTASNVRVI
jgi:hypothetical protein